jgi:hypothetical protein
VLAEKMLRKKLEEELGVQLTEKKALIRDEVRERTHPQRHASSSTRSMLHVESLVVACSKQ